MLAFNSFWLSTYWRLPVGNRVVQQKVWGCADFKRFFAIFMSLSSFYVCLLPCLSFLECCPPWRGARWQSQSHLLFWRETPRRPEYIIELKYLLSSLFSRLLLLFVILKGDSAKTWIHNRIKVFIYYHRYYYYNHYYLSLLRETPRRPECESAWFPCRGATAKLWIRDC